LKIETVIITIIAASPIGRATILAKGKNVQFSDKIESGVTILYSASFSVYTFLVAFF
jgi:hypothetical protein